MLTTSRYNSFRLPDTLATWPWPRRVNPHYAEVKAASAAWLESFHAFSPKAQKAFNVCDFSELSVISLVLVPLLIEWSLDLLASLAYPLARKGCLVYRFMCPTY